MKFPRWILASALAIQAASPSISFALPVNFIQSQTNALLPFSYAFAPNPGPRMELRTDWIIAGGIAMWGGYIPSAAIAWVGVRSNCELQGRLPSCNEGLGFYPLNIPFAGPFVGLYTLKPNGLESAGLIALGTLQIAGFGVLLTGLLWPREVKPAQALAPPSIVLLPQIGPGAMGLHLRLSTF